MLLSKIFPSCKWQLTMKSPWILFPIVSILLRFFSFFPNVIDHDESTYLVIANQLLNGDVYLRDVVDTKPIGIFWIYSFLIWISDHSIFFIRLVAAVIIGLSSALLYQISYKSCIHTLAAWSSGIIYLFLISTFTRWGMSPNTELYFNICILAAFHLSLFNPQYIKDWMCGICLGIAFHIKYVSLADTVALGLFIIYGSLQQNTLLTNGIKRILLMIAGFIIPGIIVTGYFIYHGEWNTFLHRTFDVTGNYASKPDFTQRMVFIADYLLRFLPVSLLMFFSVMSRQIRNQRLFLLYMIWFCLVMLIISIPGKYYEHYFIHIMPVSALLAAQFFTTERASFLWQKYVRSKWKIILCFLFVIISSFHFEGFLLKVDKTEILCKELKNIFKPEDLIYTGNSNHILYFLLDKDSPSKYVHPSLLWTKSHRKTMNIDPDNEVKSILSKSITYLLLSEPVSDIELKNKFLEHYKIEKQLTREVTLYKLAGYED